MFPGVSTSWQHLLFLSEILSRKASGICLGFSEVLNELRLSCWTPGNLGQITTCYVHISFRNRQTHASIIYAVYVRQLMCVYVVSQTHKEHQMYCVGAVSHWPHCTAMNQKANKHAHFHACCERNKMQAIIMYEYSRFTNFLFLL